MIKQSKNPNATANYKISSPDAKITDGVLRSDRSEDIYFSSEMVLPRQGTYLLREQILLLFLILMTI